MFFSLSHRTCAKCRKEVPGSPTHIWQGSSPRFRNGEVANQEKGPHSQLWLLLPSQVGTGRESHNLFPVDLCSSRKFLMYLFHLRSILWEPSTSITRTSCRTRILPLNSRAGLGLAGGPLGHKSKTLISQVASVLCLKLQKQWEEKISCLQMRTQNITDTHRPAHLPTHMPAWSGTGSQLHSSSF